MVDLLHNHLSKHFNVKYDGIAKNCLGIEFNQTNSKITMSQSNYIKELLERCNMLECNTVSTPMALGTKLCIATTPDDKLPYRELIGSLNYLPVCTRPDIAYSISKLSQYLTCYDKSHWLAAKKVLRYLKKTINYGLVFELDDKLVYGYSDSDWGNSQEDRKSYSGYCFMLSNSVIPWESRKQKIVALSSTESEYMSLSDSCKEALYLHKLLYELDLGILCKQITINVNNHSAIKLAENSLFHSRTKHIDIRHHFIRDVLEDGKIAVKHVSTSRMGADILTKPLGSLKNYECLKIINVTDLNFVTSPTLWVGTNLGSVLIILLTLSSSDDERYTQPVIVSPSGTVYRLKGSILSVSFLDSTGTVLSPSFEPWKSENKSNNDKERKKLSSNNHSKSKVSPTSDSQDSQLVLMCSEKQAILVTVPSQSCIQKINLTETSFVVKAEVILLKDHDKICLSCYVASGNITIYSLPSLRIICNEEFLPLVDMRVARTFCFSKNGHGVYLCSPTELQKFSISADYCNLLQDMLGTLFVNKELPEAPKQSFFKGLFGSGPSILDKEELFGVSSGKPSKNVASHVHISSNTEQIKAQSGTLGGELAKVKQNLAERGENLSQLEDRTEKMMSEAESFQSAARQLATKFKDKKWYQF
ncbi:Syntaxin-binding protein 5 [Araneus ventricosus]|uniref:Syntaxin-binding protein 5 n=1 Tax=Araneus ventricosus TaxID=182803 RepID=A0A4Y2AR52_ARAVE|nr:Syntaxin-binding protein 5 [Araneus ventricosus]